MAGFERSMTLPRTTTYTSTHTALPGGGVAGGIGLPGTLTKPVSYITFDATVGRNSRFRGLTTAQQEELGGVEYRALTVLMRIVVGYWIFSQFLAVLVVAPYLTYAREYRPQFEDPVRLNPTWFVFFQVFSAFSNNGMS